MSFEKQIRKEHRVLQKSLIVFVLFISLILGLFVYWLQSRFDFLSIL